MLELGVLLAQLPELSQFAQSQSRILLLPDVVRRLADPVLAADVGHPGAALRLSQCPQDLLFSMSLLRHLRVLLVLARGPRLPLLTQLARGSLFGFWVTWVGIASGPGLVSAHRARGSRPLPAPERVGSIDEIRRFLNVDHQG